MPKSITRETPFGRLTFSKPLDESEKMVMVYTPKGKILGYWHIDKFGGELNAQGIKNWIDLVSEKA